MFRLETTGGQSGSPIPKLNVGQRFALFLITIELYMLMLWMRPDVPFQNSYRCWCSMRRAPGEADIQKHRLREGIEQPGSPCTVDRPQQVSWCFGIDEGSFREGDSVGLFHAHQELHPCRVVQTRDHGQMDCQALSVDSAIDRDGSPSPLYVWSRASSPPFSRGFPPTSCRCFHIAIYILIRG